MCWTLLAMTLPFVGAANPPAPACQAAEDRNGRVGAAISLRCLRLQLDVLQQCRRSAA